jgi:hypothetical protein
MKTTLLVATAALAIACGPGATESHNSSEAGAKARAGVADPAKQPDVILTGCLRNADRPDATTGTSGSAGANASRSGSGGSARGAADQMAAGKGALGERFTLTHAKSASADSNPAVASYILDGNMDDLREHVDQQVRVKGTLDAAAANTAGPQRIRVDSVEMVASMCSTQPM